MPVTPTGPLSLPLHYLRQTLADAPAFRTWVGASGGGAQAAALARIHPVAAYAFTMPFAVVDWTPDQSFASYAGGARNHAQQRGALEIVFRDSINPAHDEADAAYTFLNSLGGVINDLWSLAGTAGYLDITEISLVHGPHRPEEDEVKAAGDFYQAVFKVSYQSVLEAS